MTEPTLNESLMLLHDCADFGSDRYLRAADIVRSEGSLEAARRFLEGLLNGVICPRITPPFAQQSLEIIEHWQRLEAEPAS